MSHGDALTIIFLLIGLIIPGAILLLDDPKIHGK
jgi:hypothetical protein